MKGRQHYVAEVESLLALADREVSANFAAASGEYKADILRRAQILATLAQATQPETRIIADVETASGTVRDMELAWRWHEECGEYGWVDVDDPRNCRDHRDLSRVRGLER